MSALKSDPKRSAHHRVLLVVALLYATSSSPAAGQSCIGDCNGNGAVSIEELILGVNIVLDLLPLSLCAQFDRDGSGSVEINELISAVDNLLSQCPTPDATETPPSAVTTTPDQLTPTPTSSFPPPGTASPTMTATATRSPTVPAPTATRTFTRTPLPPTATRTITRTPVAVDNVQGACRRPGPAGLITCESGTVIRVLRCDNRFTCTQQFGARTIIGEGTVGNAGGFSIAVDSELATGALLVFEADIEATIYRLVGFGRAGTGASATRGAGVDNLEIGPSSEAGVAILDDSGLVNFPDAGIVEVSDAVETANAGTSFAGLTAVQAADVAADVARQDAGVIDAVMQNKSGPLCEDTVWTEEASPFLMVQSVVVGGSLCPPGQQDVTLTIEPGVEVRVLEGLILRVRSTLIARGTPTAPIVFTAGEELLPGPGDWLGILFEDATVDAVLDQDGSYINGSVIENAIVEFADAAISTDDAVPFLKDITLRDNGGSSCALCISDSTGGMRIEGARIVSNNRGVRITSSGDPVHIINSEIANNTSTGIDNFSSLVIINSEIANNQVGINNSSNSSSLVLEDSVVRGNLSDGVIVRRDSLLLRATVSENGRDGVTGTQSGTRIVESTIRDNGRFGVQGSSVQIADSLIVGNAQGGIQNVFCEINRSCVSANGQQDSGVGIEVSGCDVSLNTLVGNSLLVTNTVVSAQQNNLLGSPAVDTTVLSSQPDLELPNNWWGTTSPGAIRARIRDCFMDGSLACVNFFSPAEAPIPEAPDIDACSQGVLVPGSN